MTQVLRNERGMALAIAIVALVVVGALVAGAFFSGTQEQRVAENVRWVQTSQGVAEAGVYDIVRAWQRQDTQASFNGLVVYPDTTTPPGSKMALSRRTLPSKTGTYSGTLWKFSGENYLIDITGQDTMSIAGRVRGGGASQRIGLLTRIKPFRVQAQASLTSGRGNVVLGNAVINGYDQAPPAWSACGALAPPVAGVRTDTGLTVTSSGGSSVITGQPNVQRDPSVNDSTFSMYGDVDYTTLAQRANAVVPGGTYTNIAPVVTSGVCDKSRNTNWGDGVNPTQPCGTYFPIIHVTGDIIITGNQGQGILLVDGNLTVQGSFQFFGITIIQGKLNTAGGGTSDAHFYGTVLAHDSVTVANNTIGGNATLAYSRCAIQRALDAQGWGVPLRSRGWVQLF